MRATAKAVGQGAASAEPTKIIKMIAGNRVAFAAMAPWDMKKLLFVSSYEESDPDSPAPKKHGYQRAPMKTRIPEIAHFYLEERHRYQITPIIVSVRLTDPDDIDEFAKMFDANDFDGIRRRWHKAIVSIVDGQHRTLGLIKAQQLDPTFDVAVPVVMYFGLEYETEAEMFDVINSTQRKLPRALIEVTKGDITELGTKSHAQTIREIAFSLARDKDSVWFEGVNMTGARDPERKVTYEGLRRSTSNMFPSELIARLDLRGERPADWAKEYWKMVAEACEVAWNEHPREEEDPDTGAVEEVAVSYRLKDLVGVAALAKLGKDLLTSALEHKNSKQWLAAQVSKLSEVDWEKREGNPWMQSQAGFAGQKDLYGILYRLVYLDELPAAAGFTAIPKAE